MSMEFGIFAQAHVPQVELDANWVGAENDRLMREVELAVEGEKAGFKYVWASEHHFLEEYSHMSAPEVFLAFVAARTKTMHIGSAIFNTTPRVNQPARVAERVAMLDHLSQGRFEFCTGRGSSSTEQQGFGIPDNDTTKSMWDETIGEFKKMWREHRYSHDGQWFKMPTRNVLPKPYSDPHPPMWVAAGNPPTFAKAGGLGLGAMCFTIGEPSSLAPSVKAYKDAIANAEPVGEFVNDTFAVVATIVCEPTREKAVEVAVRMGMNYYASLVYRWLDTFPKPDHVPDWPERIPEPTPEYILDRIERGQIIVGDPEDCARGVQTYYDMGVDQIVTGPNCHPFRTQEESLRSLRLFGSEVLPRFDKDPSTHHTTRQREAVSTTR
jgi:alkanesulfonate monooxygenase SsuD/methylene tetrahydromethanopterin reductase-like flavin-dependent oxidoreductase (luciferase family)